MGNILLKIKKRMFSNYNRVYPAPSLTLISDLKEKCKKCEKYFKVKYDCDEQKKLCIQKKCIEKFMARYGLELWTRESITHLDEENIKELLFKSIDKGNLNSLDDINYLCNDCLSGLVDDKKFCSLFVKSFGKNHNIIFEEEL